VIASALSSFPANVPVMCENVAVRVAGEGRRGSNTFLAGVDNDDEVFNFLELSEGMFVVVEGVFASGTTNFFTFIFDELFCGGVGTLAQDTVGLAAGTTNFVDDLLLLMVPPDKKLPAIAIASSSKTIALAFPAVANIAIGGGEFPEEKEVATGVVALAEVAAGTTNFVDDLLLLKVPPDKKLPAIAIASSSKTIALAFPAVANIAIGGGSILLPFSLPFNCSEGKDTWGFIIWWSNIGGGGRQTILGSTSSRIPWLGLLLAPWCCSCSEVAMARGWYDKRR